jgi:translation initiation factor 2B subunit (eIF-2B alpha/beta/delta family)
MDVASIAEDRVHGASFLAARAAEVLLATMDAGGDWKRAAVELVRAQPAMASIFTLANRALLAREPRTLIEEFLKGASDRVSAVAERAADLIGRDAVVLTHSHSSCVERAFVAAHARGTRFRVIATESRPLREGITLARSLVERGIAVRVIADAAVFRTMPEVSMVLVGADGVTPDGVVNKIGTALIALAAREYGCPVFVACTSDRIVDVRLAGDRLRAPEEIVPERIARVSVSNYYFDRTPRAWIREIITESVPPRGSELEPVHPALLEVLS